MWQGIYVHMWWQLAAETNGGAQRAQSSELKGAAGCGATTPLIKYCQNARRTQDLSCILYLAALRRFLVSVSLAVAVSPAVPLPQQRTRQDPHKTADSCVPAVSVSGSDSVAFAFAVPVTLSLCAVIALYVAVSLSAYPSDAASRHLSL